MFTHKKGGNVTPRNCYRVPRVDCWKV